MVTYMKAIFKAGSKMDKGHSRNHNMEMFWKDTSSVTNYMVQEKKYLNPKEWFLKEHLSMDLSSVKDQSI